ncbi:hypothetical protein Tco_0576712 [Tanacetum coccineum]
MSLSLAENVIVAGADNRPLMLDKTQYSSWASHMLLYIKGKENGKLLVDSVLNGLFEYGTITEPVAIHSSLLHHQSYQPPDVHQPSQASFPLMDSGPVVLSFIPSDDLIASLNKAMAFISIAFTPRNPPTNNHLRTLKRLFVATIVKRKATWQDSALNPKRPRNYAWFKEKAMFAEALESGMVLDEEQIAFLAYNEDTVTTIQLSQEIPTPVAFQIDDLDAFDSDCDEAPSASVVLMAELSLYDSEVLSNVLIHDNYLDNHVIDQNVQEM